ncbi:protein NUCLEAR FUSION DEFECTIVE 4 isoform X1 [Gastrolobium bilobum]|uniref:protein NUCLEAR FUSION DEFECTIVE 4 isoform X1 n=1 Tax=Gastrolobium bilobum TaxID=150636 RepID=UPI002AAF7AE0|nr:protein NUCLEAR FUSION DEFECTIVE 4 isoform X1 [Gastrolobium bilobum]
MPSTAFQWLSLIGSIWLQAINGTNTNFPAYSSQLKQLLSMSQVQLNNLAFASDAGKLFGCFSGMAAVYLPLWLVLMIGSTLGLIGYGVQYLFITNQISSLSYWHVFFLTVLAGNSICWINTVCYVVTIRNFSSDRQVAVGLTTSYQGLSAKIYTSIVDAVSEHKKARTFLFLNSILPVIVGLIAAPLVREIEVSRPKHMGVGFVVMFVITIATGIYAVMTSLQFVSNKISPLGNLVGIIVSLFLPLLVSVSVKISELVGSWQTNRERLRVYHFTVEESTDKERTENEMKEGEDSREVQEVGIREEIGVMLMLQRIDFWLYFFVYLFGATLGLVFLNNLGQIAESRGYSDTSSLVSLSSSFGFFGRLMPSIMDYFYRGKCKISRPASMVALMAPTAGAFFLLLNKTHVALYISTAIIGVCTGAITSISVSTTTELFGPKNFSVNHNVVVANIPIGSFLFGYLAALIYRKEGHGHGKCMGMECYKNTFIIWGSLCFFGTFLALILHARTRKFYSQKQ